MVGVINIVIEWYLVSIILLFSIFLFLVAFRIFRQEIKNKKKRKRAVEVEGSLIPMPIPDDR